MAGRLLCFSLTLVVLTGVSFASGQERSPALNGVDLKEMRKTIRSEDWFPEETRDPLKLVLAAQLLSDRAKENDDASEAYATLTEAITHSDLAKEWHLSRSILREMESRFELPPEAIKKWYQNSIRKTEFGVRLSELADLLSTEILDEKFTDNSEAWEPIHRFLTKRLEESQNSGTQFSCRERMTRVKDRLELLQKDQTPLWKGITAIVRSQDIDQGIKHLSDAAAKEISDPAKAWDAKNFSFDNSKNLLTALIELDAPNAREAAILMLQTIIEKLSYNQIAEMQDVCYSLSHELTSDFSLPYYDHGRDPGEEVRMHVSKTNRAKDLKFDKDEKSWIVKDECWLNFVQMPVTNSVHDIEFTVEKIPSFFKFRYGAHNSLRVGFQPFKDDRFRLKHERAYGHSKKSKRSKDSFAYGDRIKLTVFTLCGRQSIVINGMYMTERTLDNVWTSHQFVCEGGTKLKLHKSTLRNWLVGDRERMLRTVGDHSSLRCTEKAETNWNRDELIQYAKDNDTHSRKMSTPDAKPFVNQIGIVMQPISPGEYKRGKMEIKLTSPFWMSQHEITQIQWERVMPSNPASIQGNAHFPIDNISYKDATTFCRRLTNSAKRKRALPKGFVYRLPTEAEWEYVCRAGETESFSVEEDGFWHQESAEARYYAVGTSLPNSFGIYDMHGNVEEFTFDQYVKIPSDEKEVQINPINPPDEKDDHVSIRGGSWCMLKGDCASGKRKTGLMERCPYRGFRVVLVPVKND